MLELAKRVKLPIYLGTNQDSYRTKHIDKLIGMHFQKIFSSYEIGYLKPEPEFYQHIERELTLQPRQILLIDDTKENVQAAIHHGWKGCYYQGDISNLIEFLENESIHLSN